MPHGTVESTFLKSSRSKVVGWRGGGGGGGGVNNDIHTLQQLPSMSATEPETFPRNPIFKEANQKYV